MGENSRNQPQWEKRRRGGEERLASGLVGLEGDSHGLRGKKVAPSVVSGFLASLRSNPLSSAHEHAAAAAAGAVLPATALFNREQPCPVSLPPVAAVPPPLLVPSYAGRLRRDDPATRGCSIDSRSSFSSALTPLRRPPPAPLHSTDHPGPPPPVPPCPSAVAPVLRPTAGHLRSPPHCAAIHLRGDAARTGNGADTNQRGHAELPMSKADSEGAV
ncbi:hypothetical protein ZWY2020_010479 [Hordeum vulgare]|nr:hypothetical protein ZWY2020_010479 [Hordeum vulgare]